MVIQRFVGDKSHDVPKGKSTRFDGSGRHGVWEERVAFYRFFYHWGCSDVVVERRFSDRGKGEKEAEDAKTMVRSEEVAL